MSDSLLTLDIEKATAGGRMLARLDGQVVLVWGAIPGERVRVRVERKAKGVISAEVVEVLTASADRRDATNDWRCGGNVLSHVSYARQLLLKADILVDAFAHVGRIRLAAAPEVTGSPEHGYRMRARLHVRAGRIGFMREGSHELCPVGPTRQLLPESIAWIEAAQERLLGDRLSGVVSLEIAENAPASERACHLELQPGATLAPFAGLAGDGLTGLSAQVLDRRRVDLLAGTPFVSDILHVRPGDETVALRLRRDVRAFFQGNRFLLEPLVHRVTALVSSGPVVDLYAGVGLFGLSLAAVGVKDVTLVEGDPVSGRDLEDNAKPFGEQVRVERSSVEDFVRAASPVPGATFIVDPPRTGMSKEALAGVIRLRPERIVYVSCDVATLARDARALVEAGYALDSLSGLDLFPNTAHVESLCTFHHR